MEKRYTLLSETALVMLEMHGNLRVKGADGLEVIAETKDDEAELQIDASEEGVLVICKEDCSVLIPRKARLQAMVHGNAAFKALEGELLLEAIHGNLDLRGVGSTIIEVVHGNLDAKNILGDLTIEKLEGNANVRDVQGAFKVELIEGNLQLDDVDGGASAQVSGNVLLRLDPVPEAVYQIRADGNLMCHLSADASVKVHITEASRVVLNLPGSEGKKRNTPFQLTLGEGDAEMTLAAGGNILLAGQVPAWETMPEPEFEFEGEFEGMADMISQQVTQQLQAQMDLLEQQLNSHLSNLSATMGISGVSPEHAERIHQRAQEASQRAMERAQEKMRRAQERLERKMETIEQRAAQRAQQQAAAERRSEEMRARRSSYRLDLNNPRPPRPPQTPQPPVPPQPDLASVSDEERLMILKMLEQKQISLEQAEELLAALEGNGN